MSTCPRGAGPAIINGNSESTLDELAYDLGAEDESAGKPGRPGLPVEPRRVLRIVLENRRPLLKAFLITAAIALLGSFLVPKTYKSSAQLLFEGTPVLEPEGMQVSAEAFVQSAAAPNRFREVRDALEWDVSLEDLDEMVEVFMDGDATMTISSEAGTAEDAHDLARAVLDSFLARQARFNVKRLEVLTTENLAAIERAKARREAASLAYDAFRKKSGRPNLIREQEELLARVAGFRAKADEATVDIASQRARIEELEKARSELPSQVVASATSGSPVDTPLAQARSELASARSSLSEHHPTVQALQQRVASLQAQRKGQRSEVGERTLTANPARASVEQQLATAKAALAGATERESALRVLIEATKDEAESLALGEGEARRVRGELESADARFERLSARAAVLRDAALTQLTGFRVISAPMLQEASQRSPGTLAFLGVLPFIVVFLFALVIIVRRLRDLTVEAPREVAWWGNGPVLGTSAWPRDTNALEAFVAELEDHGVRGSGRTLVVPASEAEREVACSFAMQLAEAPWLAAAILDVGERAAKEPFEDPLVTPTPSVGVAEVRSRPRRLSSQGIPSVSYGRAVKTVASRPESNHTIQGFVPPRGGSGKPPSVVTPPPASPAPATGASSSRPPRKKTMIGLPAVGESSGTQVSTEDQLPTHPLETPPPSSGPEPFRRRRGARASVRMVVPIMSSGASATATATRESDTEEDAFLLTRPIPIDADGEVPAVAVSKAVHVGSASPESVPPTEASPDSGASKAVMRAAVRLLGEGDEEGTALQRGERPSLPVLGDTTAVALAWNGPLSGPLLRRAARLAHRVVVVVSAGTNGIELTRIQRRLGRKKGVGYVLVNVGDAYVDLDDRVGAVEEFWDGVRDTDSQHSR